MTHIFNLKFCLFCEAQRDKNESNGHRVSENLCSGADLDDCMESFLWISQVINKFTQLTRTPPCEHEDLPILII